MRTIELNNNEKQQNKKWDQRITEICTTANSITNLTRLVKEKEGEQNYHHHKWKRGNLL